MVEAVAMEEDRWRRWKDYADALEEERRKIEVFWRELPLCLDLITQTIEDCRTKMEENKGVVLEEFMLMSGGSAAEEEDDDRNQEGDMPNDEEQPATAAEECDRRADWLRSVQLWSGQSCDQDQNRKIKGKKPIVAGTGAFRPFSKEIFQAVKEPTSTAVPPPSPSPVAVEQQLEPIAAVAENSTEETVGGEGCGSSGQASGGGPRKGRSRGKTRGCWSAELHRRFLSALQQLGGAQSATPKQIRELMKVEGLTSDEIKSHLQKYRLHARQSIAGPQSQSHQFIFVSGIWVPPPELAATVAATPIAGDGGDPPAKVIFSPVALLPSQENCNTSKLKKTFTTVPLQQARSSEIRNKISSTNTNTNIPAVTSSSEQSTSTSRSHES